MEIRGGRRIGLIRHDRMKGRGEGAQVPGCLHDTPRGSNENERTRASGLDYFFLREMVSRGERLRLFVIWRDRRETMFLSVFFSLLFFFYGFTGTGNRVRIPTLF